MKVMGPIPRVITANESGFPLPPALMKDTHPRGAFNGILPAHETRDAENAAWYIIKMFQEKKKGWFPFRFEDIQEVYSQYHGGLFDFHALVEETGSGLIIRDDEGLYRVTDCFVEACISVIPAIKEKKPVTSRR